MEKAMSTTEKPRVIIRASQATFSDGQAVAAVRASSLTQAINRLRRKTNIFESDPQNRENIQMPFDMVTKKGDPFLWDDTGVDDTNRILIFSKQKSAVPCANAV